MAIQEQRVQVMRALHIRDLRDQHHCEYAAQMGPKLHSVTLKLFAGKCADESECINNETNFLIKYVKDCIQAVSPKDQQLHSLFNKCIVYYYLFAPHLVVFDYFIPIDTHAK